MTDPTLLGDTPGDAGPRVLGGNGPGAGDSTAGSRGACATASSGVARGDAVVRVAGQFEALVAGLRSLGGELLEERLGLVGRCEAGLAALRSETVAELARRDGEARAADAVHDQLRQSRGSAKRDVKLAGQLADLPDTQQALADGAITPQHARIIAEAAEHTAVGEAELLAAAEREPTDVFGHTVRDHVNRRTAEEDLQERRRRQRARRELSIKQQSDGMYKLFGLFDPIAGARIETALAAATRKLRRGEDPADRATPAQRSADALEILITRQGGAKPQSTTLIVIANYDVIAERLHDAALVDGTPLAADELLQLALEARIVPALFDTAGQPLWLGRENRDATEAQRLALFARDRRCIGCAATHNWCQPHHERPWEHGGPTDIDNLCLLCSDCHHRRVHNNGASIETAANGRRTLRDPHSHHPPTAGHPRATDRNDRHNATHSRRAGTGSTINQPLRL